MLRFSISLSLILAFCLINSFVFAQPLPNDPYIPLEGLVVEHGRVAFLSLVSDHCIVISDRINGVTYTIHYSKWQQRYDATSPWIDISGTTEDGQLCSFSPEEPGQYRLVCEISIEGVRGTYASENILEIERLFEPSRIEDQTFIVGTPVHLTLPRAVFGTPPYTYDLRGIPAGLQFNTRTRVLSGTPTTPGRSYPQYHAEDAERRSHNLSFRISVFGGSPAVVSVEPPVVPSPAVGEELMVSINITGGVGVAGYEADVNFDPTAVKYVSHANGDYLSPGAIPIPTEPTENSIKVSAVDIGATADGDGTLATVTFKVLEVKASVISLSGVIIADAASAPLAVTTVDGIITADGLRLSPNAIDDQTFVVNTPIDPVYLPLATGGAEPYTYTLTPIPAGLQFDTATYILSGTPTTVTPATLTTYTATDATGQTAFLTFTITVTNAPTASITFVPSMIDDLTLSVNMPMEPLSLPLAEGGTPPYTYTLDPIPAGILFDATIQLLSGTPTTVGTTAVTYAATDTTGASAALTFTIEVTETGPGPLDVNGDGMVSVLDLVWVAIYYGMRAPVGVSLPADVNADGVVNVTDFILVAAGVDAAGGRVNTFSIEDVEIALLAAEAQVVEDAVAEGPASVGRYKAIAVRNVATAVSDVKPFTVVNLHLSKSLTLLERLLSHLREVSTRPNATALLPNYPNPFNPETWFPYHLAKAAEVTLTIYDMRGASVRELVLGHQTAGVYESRGRAAYWDGRNRKGEPVASGVYFYTLTAGDFTATRKLLIRK